MAWFGGGGNQGHFQQNMYSKGSLYYKFLTQAGDAFIDGDPQRTARAVRMLEITLSSYLRELYHPNRDSDAEFSKGELERVIKPMAINEADTVLKVPFEERKLEKREEWLRNQRKTEEWESEFYKAFSGLRLQYCTEVIDENRLLGDAEDWISVERRKNAEAEEAARQEQAAGSS